MDGEVRVKESQPMGSQLIDQKSPPFIQLNHERDLNHEMSFELQKMMPFKKKDEAIYKYRKEMEQVRKEADQLKLQSSQLRKMSENLKNQVEDFDEKYIAAALSKGGVSAPCSQSITDQYCSEKIRTLEGQLQLSLCKCSEAQRTGQTYKDILKQLKNENQDLSDKVAALEEDLRVKDYGYKEVLLLSGDVKQAAEAASQDLAHLNALYEEVKKKRAQDLRYRQVLLEEICKDQENRSVLQDKSKGQPDSDAKLDKDKRDLLEKKAHSQVQEDQDEEEGAEEDAHNIDDNDGLSSKQIEVDILEEYFQKFKQTMNVSELHEVIDKITTQEERTEQLIAMSNENQGKIENLNQLKEELKSLVDDMKCNILSWRSERQSKVKGIDETLMNSSRQLEKIQTEFEETRRLLVRIQYYLETLCYNLSKNIVMEEEPLQTSDEGLTRPLVLIKRCLDCIKELKFHAV